MGAMLASLRNTVAAGFALAILLYVLIRLVPGDRVGLDGAWWTLCFRWLHVMSGTMWIGLLWYFNFVQIPEHGQNPRSSETSHRQGNRASRTMVVPVERNGDNGHRSAPCVDERLSAGCPCDGADRRRPKHANRHWHVARDRHVDQCLVRRLAKPR